MEFTAQLALYLVLTAAVLLWAKWSRLDLGLRAPVFKGVWPWILLYMTWLAAEWAVFTLHPVQDDPEWLEWMRQLSLLGALILLVELGPLFEELLFRGAMFSALMRRKGIWFAALVPSILWGLIHIGYEAWFVASVAGSGAVLAIIRWKSGSLYVPLCLHAAGNLLVTLNPYLPFAVTV